MTKTENVIDEAIIKFYQKRHNLKTLTRQELEHIPRTLLLTFGQDNISELWHKLPLRLRQDPVLSKHRICKKHLQSDNQDQFDGPPPQIRHCNRCRQNEEDQKVQDTPMHIAKGKAEIEERNTEECGSGSD